MDNTRKGIGWFTLELYTPTPSEITTNMEVGIDTGTNSGIEIDIGSQSNFFVKTKTVISEER